MRWLEYGQRLKGEMRGALADADGNVASTLLAAGTTAGARALGLDAGRIAPGAWGDWSRSTSTPRRSRGFRTIDCWMASYSARVTAWSPGPSWVGGGGRVPDILERLRAALADRYRLDRELGQGGMATVYLAEDLKHRRKVALKVLRPELAATLGPDRFFREIEVAARLQHPHILPLHDSGEAQGFLYYVMPFVEGQNLRGRLTRQGELPIHEAVKLLAEVADALAYAHAQGVVHRDIKPDNVLLSGRHALVTDFGVAKAVSEATGRQALTTAGIALGTPAYMAPEQAAADPNLDHRVDIYALGAMGYELLAGRPPFTGLSSQEVLAAHVTQQPESVATRRPAVPDALAAVIMKCLAKRPADRWQSADEVLSQLEQQLTPSVGMTPTQTRPTDRSQHRRRARGGDSAVSGPSSSRPWRPASFSFAVLRRRAEPRQARRRDASIPVSR